MIPVHLVRRSTAPVRAAPAAAGPEIPKPRRAWMAGFTGRAGEAAEFVGRRRRTLLVGLGPRADAPALEAAGALAVARLPRDAHLALDARGLSPELACAFAAGAVLRAWQPTPQRAAARAKPDPDAPRLARLDLVVDDPDAIATDWAYTHAAISGTWLARDLVAEPSDTLTPAGFVTRLGPLLEAGVTIEVLDAARLREEGFGALLAVGRASVHPPGLLVLRWAGTRPDAPVALVGKGITFDTGGVCIKPAEGLWEMRADMAGAAACAGAMLALARRRSPAPVVAVLPLAENAVGADAYRPGDVLRTVSGRTVEVVDTDAEGRLVLADALSWAVLRLRPRAIVDLATLTGSIITALGHHMAGAFGTEALVGQTVRAGQEAREPAWPMPIGARHRRDLDSTIADLRHCVPGRFQPDACQAAAFLKEFTDALPWVHLDIAGVESRQDADDRHPAGPTGFGVRLLDRLIHRSFEAPA